ncbi:hypothetical protein ABMA28_011042 [Loxostege sticticalis]|uniref:trypsin n=1 Tax=Loxostege sticticalis TaxID=481309 RepID=A0ABD0S633_LOXSC
MAACARYPWICQISVVIVCLFYGVAGNPVSIKTVPFVAWLQSHQHRCAASVVHERFLLTAASCLIDDAGRPINITKALVGTNNLTKGGRLYAIQFFYPHKKYSMHTGDYNVGLVKLAQKIIFGPKVGPIKLGKRVQVGDLVNVVGWGSDMKSTGVLQKATVAVLPADECQGGLLGRIIGPRMVCAGAAGRGECVGDEGGPVFVNNTLVAVVSPFRSCGALPALYTRVASVRRWIRDTIFENSDIEF